MFPLFLKLGGLAIPRATAIKWREMKPAAKARLRCIRRENKVNIINVSLPIQETNVFATCGTRQYL